MKPFVQGDAWVIDHLFQPVINHSPLLMQRRPAVLALFFLLASSCWVLIQLVNLAFFGPLDHTAWNLTIIPAGVCFLMTTLLILIAVSLCEKPALATWFRDRGLVVRLAFLVGGILTLFHGAWIAVVIWLWWLATYLMGCQPVTPP